MYFMGSVVYVPCLFVEFWVRKARWNQNGHSRWLATAQLQPLEYVSKSTEQSQGSVNAPKCERWFPPWSGTRVGDRAGFAAGVQKSSKRNRPLMSCFHPRNPPWKLNVIPGKAQKLRVHYVTQKLHVLESKWSRMCGPQMILPVPEMIKLFFIRMKNQLTWIHHRWLITHPNHCETIYQMLEFFARGVSTLFFLYQWSIGSFRGELPQPHQLSIGNC